MIGFCAGEFENGQRKLAVFVWQLLPLPVLTGRGLG